MRYVEFAVTSNFSFLRGASHPEELMARAEQLGLAGLGLADRNSVAGVVRAHVARRESELKIRYHPGSRLVFADGTPDILAYPRDRAGWGKLCRLLTLGNRRADKGDCILHLEDLLEHAEGLELVVMAEATGGADGLPPLDDRAIASDEDSPLAPPLPACGERSTREARRVRGRLRESEPVATPPHRAESGFSAVPCRPLPARGARNAVCGPPALRFSPAPSRLRLVFKML